jgi:hypothetical protein
VIKIKSNLSMARHEFGEQAASVGGLERPPSNVRFGSNADIRSVQIDGNNQKLRQISTVFI